MCLFLASVLPTFNVAATADEFDVQPVIHAELKEHTKHFRKQIYKIAENVYSAVGWNIANVVMIEGDEGIILVDVGLSPDTSKQVKKEFEKITLKPVVAVIYSHFHHDHIDGIKAFVTDEDVQSGKVAIYAHTSLMKNLADESNLLGTILGYRAGYTFGFFLPEQDKENMNSGIGPIGIGGHPGSFIAPSHLITDHLKVNIAGVDLEIIHVPSEAPDELAVYLPQSNVLIDTEVIQGPTFPNLHTLRGTKFRDPVQWVQSIDRLREFRAEYLVPTHGQPVYGAEKVEEVLRMTRDGIQFVHDQTVRYMNKGLVPDELVEVVKLPPHLGNYKPYLREYYGTVAQAVREIYAGYIGWFEGDPVDLNPTPRQEYSRRLVALMGGREKVLAAAHAAYGDNDPQWAAELLSHLIRLDRNDAVARKIKAAAFRRLGYASMNINWRNWYLTSAMELEGKLDQQVSARQMANIFLPPDMIGALSADALISGWPSRLKAEETLDVGLTLGIQLTDESQGLGLEIRGGVCQFHQRLPEVNDITIELARPLLNRVLAGGASFVDMIEKGDIKLHGELAEFVRFLSYFEAPEGNSISLTLQ
jgi:alkyl sulfatase BDS1-like metallo-beta-lactamase superfamily hydrolase